MRPIHHRLTLTVLALGIALPAIAQDAAAPAGAAPAAPAAEAPAAPAAETPAAPAADAPATPAAPAAPGAAPAAPAGEAAAPAQPQKPEVMEIVKDTFGDWQVRCAPDGNQCFMYQLALDAGKNPVAEVSILKLAGNTDAEAGVTVVTPLGTLLPNGVVVQIDTGEQRQYPFAWCSQVGCFSRFGLTKPAVDAMKRGKAGKITLVSITRPEAPVVLNLSLSGFTAAFESLQPPPAVAAAPAPAPAPAAPSLANDPAPLAPRN